MCAVGGDRKNGKKGEKELQWKRRLGKLNDLNMIAKGRQRPLLAFYICLACLPCAIKLRNFSTSTLREVRNFYLTQSLYINYNPILKVWGKNK